MTQILYRHFEGDTLLYVGVTDDYRRRTAVHSRLATWWPRVDRSTTVTYPDRAAVLAAEERAIRTERPLFNRAGHAPSFPPATARRIIITGSREFTDGAIVASALESYLGTGVIVVHGCARGPGQLAQTWAMLHGIQGVFVEPHPARWREYGKRAEVIRDMGMVSLGAEACLAFYRGRVEAHCAALAEAAGIPVREFWQP